MGGFSFYTRKVHQQGRFVSILAREDYGGTFGPLGFNADAVRVACLLNLGLTSPYAYGLGFILHWAVSPNKTDSTSQRPYTPMQPLA